jgi:endonuclease YncB( thermonuclease family)
MRAALLCVAMLTFANLPAAAEVVDGRRIVIVDGDTIALRNERVRLLNVDAPDAPDASGS